MKRKNRSKRSLGSLPKGLPVRGASKEATVNPFESASRHKRQKHEVVNRPTTGTQQRATQSALARALAERKEKLRAQLAQSKKSSTFVDKRIGEYSRNMTPEERNLARIVKERSRRSRRSSKYNLEDNDDNGNEESQDVLTHGGRAITSLSARDHVMLSDDEDEDGPLDAVDTLQHFGGGKSSSRHKQAADDNPYGPAGSSANGQNLTAMYSSRKMELDDLIHRRKVMKAERLQSKEAQVDAFEKMDQSFADLAAMLNFRDKEKEIKDYHQAKQQGKLSAEDQEYDDWDREMKQYQFVDRKVKATDRTKTGEEIAKEEAERLHELETRRLARMNGEFDEDDFSDISGAELTERRRGAGADDLDNDSDEEAPDDNELRTRFTADGLVKIDKGGNVVGKFGQDSNDKDKDAVEVLPVGARVSASYHAKEQMEGEETWFDGSISAVNRSESGKISYNVDYDDGDFEDDVEPQHVREIEKTIEEKAKEKEEQSNNLLESQKRQKAQEKARTELPYVFEVPTTLEALHDMIATYASTGKDASTIIKRIHACSSVRLNKKNAEKMQNFYDVLLRRFIAVGDAIHRGGDGGPELGRYEQLNELNSVLYTMAQESPEMSGAIWARRIGILHNAHSKRLRDAEFVSDEEPETAWPSTGIFLLLRSLGHIFPVTDKRHYIVTPAMLLLGQMISHTPVQSTYDLVLGLLCCGLMIEYTREAKRFSPEALSFISGVIRLYAAEGSDRISDKVLPTISSCASEKFAKALRPTASQTGGETQRISLYHNDIIQDKTAGAILFTALSLAQSVANSISDAMEGCEREALGELTESLLCINPSHKNAPLDKTFKEKIAATAKTVSSTCQYEMKRTPLTRRAGEKLPMIKTLAPKMHDPERYSFSKDKGKSPTQAHLDRTRRELKREKKAISRELRLDAAFVESERREEKNRRDSEARAKRRKAYSWLQMEQGTMNQQVRQGGGLLSGGGMGAARAKARSGKLGIKKGGKF